MGKFGLSDVQAQAILEMRLQRLTGLEREKILQELKEVKARSRGSRRSSREAELLRVVAAELKEVRDAYADERRSQIVRRRRSCASRT